MSQSSFRLLFLVQVHEVTRQLRWLIRWLTQDGDLCLISADCPIADLDAPPGVTIVRSPPVTWGGYSQVSTLLESYARAVMLGDWDFVINLSGTCFPTKPLSALKEFLHQLHVDKTSLVGSVRYGDPKIEALRSFEHSRFKPLNLLKSRGVSLYCDKNVEDSFKTMQESPVFHAEWRAGFYVEDIAEAKTLIVRALSEFEAEYRRRILKEYPLYFGRAWYCFRKEAIPILLDLANASPIATVLRNSFEPDEIFIQTIIRNHPDAMRIENRSLYADWGAPNVVTAEAWQSFAPHDSFFVRKVNLWDFDKVLQVAEPTICRHESDTESVTEI